MEKQKNIFEKLYKELYEECEGACYLFTNDLIGYRKWYKGRLFQLCLRFKDETEKCS